MTLLEFCEGFFPEETLFSQRDGRIAVKLGKLDRLEREGQDSGRLTWAQVKPTDILGSVEPADDIYCWTCRFEDKADEENEFIMSEIGSELMRRFRLEIDPEVAGMDFDVRRPYFRMRGRPVTEAQAFELIRRTDFSLPSDVRRVDRVEHLCVTICNDWYSTMSFVGGWVRPNGVLGQNGCTAEKYPLESEFVRSTLPLKLAFPYLDLVIAVTDWNEGPKYAWETYFNDDSPSDSDVFAREKYPDFLEHIVYGIWLHDDAMELMSPARATEKYLEYNRLYGGRDEHIFNWSYYQDNRIHPADLSFLKRCIRFYGLDPEKVLAPYDWGPRGLVRRDSFYSNTTEFA